MLAERTPSEALPHAPPGFLGWVSRLVRAHRATLLGNARRRGLSADDALDAVQDAFLVFLRLPEARAMGEDPTSALKMLTVLLRHGTMNRRRKTQRRARGDAELSAVTQGTDESTDELLVRVEELARVRGCILRMAELQRRVVELSLVEGLSHDGVGASLGISEGYARVLLHRARAHVRGCTFDYEESEGT